MTVLHLMACGLESNAAYGIEHSAPLLTPEELQEYRRTDSYARIQMRTKLVQLEKHHLQLALRYLEQTEDGSVGAAASSDRLDLFLRYSTTARREFYRTLNSYLEIKGNFI